jgi:orotate phosphoribosyltransferase
MRPTHQGGTRDARKLYDELVLIGDLPKGTVILVDDVFTTGGHILAAAARISTAGGHCCYAICVARTVSRPQESRFSITQEMVPHVLTQFARCAAPQSENSIASSQVSPTSF